MKFESAVKDLQKEKQELESRLKNINAALAALTKLAGKPDADAKSDNNPNRATWSGRRESNPYLKLGKLVVDSQKRTNWRLFVVLKNVQMDSNWSSGRKNRNWQRRVEVEPKAVIENM